MFKCYVYVEGMLEIERLQSDLVHMKLNYTHTNINI